jgi:hypothetical protein
MKKRLVSGVFYSFFGQIFSIEVQFGETVHQSFPKLIEQIILIDVQISKFHTSDKYKMDTKLTIRLKSEVIERAKNYASEQKISLSKLVETYLDTISKPKTEKSEDIQITPLVKSLMGAAGSLPENYDYKKEYREYIEKKYQ